MKNYKEYMQERMAEFKQEKANELWHLRDAINMLSHYAAATRDDGDTQAADVFDKYLAQAKDTLKAQKQSFTDRQERLEDFFAERDLNVSEWD